MEAKKILSANFLDLLFDNRNKDYGAYELRVTYPERVKRSLIVVFSLLAVVIAGVAFGNSFKPAKNAMITYKTVDLAAIKPEEKKPEPIPKPPKKVDPPRIHTEPYTQMRIVNDDSVQKPPPTQAELELAKIDVKQQDGTNDDGIVKPPEAIDKGIGIIEPKPASDEPAGVVEVPARYDGDWIKFLTRNLNPDVPVSNGAPSGKYNVLIQFVVDKEGNVSDITPLTNLGFGMEQEAIRVLKKAKGWKPGIQNGHEVKCYHKQPITFIVEDSN